MNKSLKILCVCRSGTCRSIGTRYCLVNRGYTNVIAVGGVNTSLETLAMLYRWADIILLAKPKHKKFLPDGRGKINKKFTIGEDVWFNPMAKELHEIVNKQLDKIGLV